MAKLGGGVFLLVAFQVVFQRLYCGFNHGLIITLYSVNMALKHAEVMRYEIPTEASRQMPEAESQPATEKILLFKGGFSLNAERLSERTYIEDENHWHGNLENRSAGKGKICEYDSLEWSWPLFTRSSEEEDSDRRSDSCSDEFSGPSSL